MPFLMSEMELISEFSLGSCSPQQVFANIFDRRCSFFQMWHSLNKGTYDVVMTPWRPAVADPHSMERCQEFKIDVALRGRTQCLEDHRWSVQTSNVDGTEVGVFEARNRIDVSVANVVSEWRMSFENGKVYCEAGVYIDGLPRLVALSVRRAQRGQLAKSFQNAELLMKKILNETAQSSSGVAMERNDTVTILCNGRCRCLEASAEGAVSIVSFNIDSPPSDASCWRVVAVTTEVGGNETIFLQNAASDRYLGFDIRGRVVCTAQQPKAWEIISLESLDNEREEGTPILFPQYGFGEGGVVTTGKGKVPPSSLYLIKLNKQTSSDSPALFHLHRRSRQSVTTHESKVQIDGTLVHTGSPASPFLALAIFCLPLLVVFWASLG